MIYLTKGFFEEERFEAIRSCIYLYWCLSLIVIVGLVKLLE